jgi:hypothetical protein
MASQIKKAFNKARKTAADAISLARAESACCSMPTRSIALSIAEFTSSTINTSNREDISNTFSLIQPTGDRYENGCNKQLLPECRFIFKGTYQPCKGKTDCIDYTSYACNTPVGH